MKLKKAKTDAEEVVPPQAEIIEADLYKRSYFGPDVPTLELECWEDELSEAQLQAYKNADDEYKSIQNKLDEMVKDTGGEIVYNGDQFTAYQLLGKQPVLKDLERQSADIIRSRSRSLSISKEKTHKRGRPRKTREDREYSPSPERVPTPEPKHKKKKKDKEKFKEKEKEKEKDKEVIRSRDKSKDSTKTKDKTLAPSNVHSVVTNVRPSEATAIGGLLTGSATKTTAIVDLTKEDGNKNVADSREVSFNKLQVFGRAKTNAEKCKEYYYRKKAAKAAEKQGLPAKKKTGAERTRACRLRKKMLAQINQSSGDGILKTSSTSVSQIIISAPSVQPVTTDTNLNYFEVPIVSSSIASHVDNNFQNSLLSTVIQDNRNVITVQAMDHMENSTATCYHPTKPKIYLKEWSKVDNLEH